MRQLTSIQEIQTFVQERRKLGNSIGFVPTMGALHEGHLSLVHECSALNSVTIVSIFVNPTQFNNPDDLKKYPRTIAADIQLLEETNCDAVFIPEVETIYSKDFVAKQVNLGLLGETMEGFFRPGHFDGVVSVVQRLFSIVQPDTAFFGRKDFQQVAVIRQLVESLDYRINIHEVATKREVSGLAMSSRNVLLSKEERQQASIIFDILSAMVSLAVTRTPAATRKQAFVEFKKTPLRVEYLEIVHPRTFEKLSDKWIAGATVCVVAYCGQVRLIDNLELIPKGQH